MAWSFVWMSTTQMILSKNHENESNAFLFRIYQMFYDITNGFMDIAI